MDGRSLALRGLRRARGGAGRRPPGGGQPLRTRFPWRRNDAALRPGAARGRSAVEPHRRDRRRYRQPPHHRWTSGARPVDRVPGDGDRDRARAPSRRVRDGSAERPPHRPRRPLGRAGGGRRHGLDPLHERGVVAAHKGYALAMICELLAAALIGGPTTRPQTMTMKSAIWNNMLALVFDPARLGSPGTYEMEARAFIDWVRSAPLSGEIDSILMPGDPERRCRKARADAVPIDSGTLAQLDEAAQMIARAKGRSPGPLSANIGTS